MSEYTATIDAAEYPPHLMHKTIFETLGRLQPNEAMLLINDHGPKPLRFQFESMHADKFEREYAEQGPVTLRVRISKLA